MPAPNIGIWNGSFFTDQYFPGSGIVADPAFRLTLTTPTDNFNVVIPLVGSGDVDRGDGTSGTFNGDYSHTYATAGTYRLAFDNGNISSINIVAQPATADTFENLTEFGIFSEPLSVANMFRFCRNMRVSAFDRMSLAGFTGEFSQPFRDAGVGSFNGFRMDGRTSLLQRSAFQGCGFSSVRLPSDNPYVLDSINGSMFLSSANMALLDLGSCTELRGNHSNFANSCTSLSLIVGLGSVTVSQLTNVNSMFRNIPFRPDIGNWKFSSALTIGFRFLAGTGTDQYDQFLITNAATDWSGLAGGDATLDMGDSVYDANDPAVVASRQRIIDAGITLQDGGPA